MTPPEKLVGAVGVGWLRIVFDALEQAGQLGTPVRYEQMKEKFGELRIYAHMVRNEQAPDGDDAEKRLEKILDAARDASLVTCEACGAPAVAERTRVRCTACANRSTLTVVCLSASGVISHQ